MLKLTRGLAAFVLLTALVAGCGGDNGGAEQEAGETAAEEERASLTVGLIPIAPVVPVFIAQEQGFFEEENLEVETQMAQGGAAIIPAVQAGEFDIGFSNIASLLIARSRGLPVKVVVGGEVAAQSEDEDDSAIMVAPDSPIREPGDVVGKKVGVNTLQNIAGLSVRASLENLDLEPSIQEVEVPFPEMLPTLQQGGIEAGFFNEPFTTLAKQEGMRTVFKPYTTMGEGLPIAPYFALESFVDENGDVIERFRRAMERATEFAQENPDAVRQTLPTYTEIPEPVAQEMGLPDLNAELDQEKFQTMSELATKFGLIEEEVDVSELLIEE